MSRWWIINNQSIKSRGAKRRNGSHQKHAYQSVNTYYWLGLLFCFFFFPSPPPAFPAALKLKFALRERERSAHTFSFSSGGHIVIDELAESRKEDGDGVIVIAEIAMDGGRNVTGGGQLFAGDWNARHADVCVLDDLIGRLFDLNGWLRSFFFEEYGKKGTKKYRRRSRAAEDGGIGMKWRPSLDCPNCCTFRRSCGIASLRTLPVWGKSDRRSFWKHRSMAMPLEFRPFLIYAWKRTSNQLLNVILFSC